MPTLNIGGRRVKVDDSFLELSPEDQNATVDEIAQSFGPPNAKPETPDANNSQEKPAPSLGEIPLKALMNVPKSAVEFGKNIVQPILHPIDTAVAVGNLGKGVLQKTGIMSGEDAIPYADATGQMLLDRYGSYDAIKRTLADDPVGALADASLLFTGGGAAAARAPGMLGKVGETVGNIGRAIDPLTIAGKGMGHAAKGTAVLAREGIGSFGTHTGGESIKTAARSGYEGSQAGKAFQEHLRGLAPLEEPVQEMRGALSNMRSDKNSAFSLGKDTFTKNTAALDFDKIDDALADITKVGTVPAPGGLSLIVDPSTQKVRQAIGQAVQEWKDAKVNTVQGFDGLKRRIGDIRDNTAYGSPERYVADHAYHAVKNTIEEWSPEYRDTMKGYENAMRDIREIEQGLNLKNRTSIDSSLRSLQSVLRNNVNTNYGYRTALAKDLATHGAPLVTEKLAGQALNPWTPRGLGKITGPMGAMGALYGGGVGGLLALPLMSPRAIGEAAYYGGRAAKGVSKLSPLLKAARKEMPGLFQLGRITEPPRNLLLEEDEGEN